MPKRFNDTLALIIVIAVLSIFAANGAGWLPNLSETVTGALITLLVAQVGQFYYRRKEPE